MKRLLSTVSRIQKHDEGVYSLFFISETSIPRFKPGQFLHLALDNYDPAGGFWPDSRVFSICSSSGQGELRIIYSVKGAFTKRMQTELKPGSQIWLKIPYGDFIISESETQPITLVAGGTGISPFIPFIEKIIAAEGPLSVPVWVFYGCRTFEQLIFLDLLTEAKKRNPLFEFQIYLEKTAYSGYAGKISNGNIAISEVARDKYAKIYLSGPPSMISYFRDNLPGEGIDPGNIYIDAWE